MQINIDQDRLQRLPPLRSGNHEQNDGTEMCVMEAVAWVTRSPWSDHPKCVCPVIGAFMRSWNDGINTDAERSRLLAPLIPIIVNTRSYEATANKRATMAADWLVRVHTPAWLRLAKLDGHADALEALPEITDFSQCPSLMPALRAARTDAAAASVAARAAASVAARAAARAAASAAASDAARAAASVAARAAASVAARAAARAAARDAASDAAWAAASAAAWAAARAAASDAARDAASDAARDAASDAAWAAAWAAASDAASDAVSPTLNRLQDSAADLVRRMAQAA